VSASRGNGVIDTLSNGNGAGPADPGSTGLGGQDPGHGGAAQRRPEVAVGAAFAGGFLLALLLRRMRS